MDHPVHFSGPDAGVSEQPPHFVARQPPASWNRVCKRNTGKGSPEFIHGLHTQSHRHSPGPLASPLNTLAAGNPPRDGPARELGAGLQEGLHQGETPRFKQREFFLQETFSSLDPGAGGSLSCLLHHLQGLPPPSPATSPFLLKEAPSGFFLHLQPVPLPKVTLACLCWNKCSVITVCLAWPAAGGFCLMSKGPGTFQGMTVSGGLRRVATGRLTPDVRCPPRGAMSLFLLNPTRGSKAVLSRRFLGNLR